MQMQLIFVMYLIIGEIYRILRFDFISFGRWYTIDLLLARVAV